MSNKIGKYKPYIILLAVTLFLELFLFNWRFFEGMGYETMALDKFVCGSGVSQNGEELQIQNDGDKFIEFQGFDTEVDNLYINIIDKRNFDEALHADGVPRSYQQVSVTPSITDEANLSYLTMPERNIIEGVERTKYIKLHTAGKSDSLRIHFNNCEGQTLILKQIALNKQVPFHMSPLRMLFLFGVLTLLYSLRPGSPVYHITFQAGSRLQIGAVAILVTANILLSSFVCVTNPAYTAPLWEHHKQYANLADAFLDGRLYLDHASQSLTDMENPYDFVSRSQTLEVSEQTKWWDHAYYEGKYYVYFGAFPVLVYYMPYKFLTGKDFPTYVGVLLNINLFILAAFLLFRAVIKRWFSGIPFVSYLLLTQVFVASSGILFALRKPDMYCMPITMALTLVMAGLTFWITSDGKKALNQGIRLAAGSLCMALVVGCRPQFLIASFLAIPLFWKKAVKDRELFSRKSIGHTLAFVLPYAAAAAVAMWYNFARFGSVFDFGANYNLTMNDMTRRGMNLGRVPLGFFAYFLQLPATYPQFPFVTETTLSNLYMGTTILEAMFGGILTTQPIVWLTALAGTVRAKLKEKGLFIFVICSAVFSVLVSMADTQMAGILNRYYMDYSYLMLLPALLIAFLLMEKYRVQKQRGRRVVFAISVLCLLCLLYDSAILFVPCDLSHNEGNPNLYYTVTSALTFWL